MIRYGRIQCMGQFTDLPFAIHGDGRVKALEIKRIPGHVLAVYVPPDIVFRQAPDLFSDLLYRGGGPEFGRMGRQGHDRDQQYCNQRVFGCFRIAEEYHW